MKILFLTRLFHPHIGGVEKHVREVARELISRGHQVTVLTENHTGNLESRETLPESTQIYRISTYSSILSIPECLKKFKIWGWLWRNRELIEKADIVHAHDVAFWYFPFRFFYPQKPFYITFHGWEGKFPIPFKNKLIRKISEKLAQGNICVGDFIEKWYGTKPNFVTYGGIKLKTQSSKLKSTSKNAKLITFIGRLEEDTGLPIFLEAWGKARNKLRYHRLEFLGDGRLRKQAEKFGKIHGFVKDLRQYILKSHFVFSSSYLTILEALICQRLVFTVYDNPLKEDYLKLAPFSKWIVICDSAEELKDKLLYYIKQPKKATQLIKPGHDWAIKQSWSKMAVLYLKLWNSPSS